MDRSTKHILAVVFMSFFLATLQGVRSHNGGCSSLRDVKLSQQFIGKDAGGLMIYKVVMKNQCSCTLTDLFLSCGTTFTPKVIEPSDILTRNNGENCRVNWKVPAGGSVSFEYRAEGKWPGLDVSIVGCAAVG